MKLSPKRKCSNKREKIHHQTETKLEKLAKIKPNANFAKNWKNLPKLSLRASTLVHLKISIYFNIRTYFFYCTPSFFKNTHIIFYLFIIYFILSSLRSNDLEPSPPPPTHTHILSLSLSLSLLVCPCGCVCVSLCWFVCVGVFVCIKGRRR